MRSFPSSNCPTRRSGTPSPSKSVTSGAACPVPTSTKPAASRTRKGAARPPPDGTDRNPRTRIEPSMGPSVASWTDPDSISLGPARLLAESARLRVLERVVRELDPGEIVDAPAAIVQALNEQAEGPLVHARVRDPSEILHLPDEVRDPLQAGSIHEVDVQRA